MPILFFPLSYVGVFPSFFPWDVIHCKKLQRHPHIYLHLMALKHFGHYLKPKKIVTEQNSLLAFYSFEWILFGNIISLIVARPRERKSIYFHYNINTIFGISQSLPRWFPRILNFQYYFDTNIPTFKLKFWKNSRQPVDQNVRKLLEDLIECYSVLVLIWLIEDGTVVGGRRE